MRWQTTSVANQPTVQVPRKLENYQKNVPHKETYQQSLLRIFPIGEDYTLIKEIGKGSYGLVVSAIERHTGKVVAIKKISNVF